MAKATVNILVFLSFMVFAGCGGNGERSANNSTEAAKPGPIQPSTVPDAERVLIEINVKAIGNTMQDMDFDKDVIKISENNRVKLVLVNEGSGEAMVHNLVIVRKGTMEKVAMEGLKAGKDYNYVAPGDEDVYIASSLIAPGTVTTMEFDAPVKGEYEFVCTYPGHWQAMNGRFIVE